MNECIVEGCTNKRDDGNFKTEFVGDLCLPCYEMITTGKTGIMGTTFIHDLNTKILNYEKLIENLTTILEDYLNEI